VTSKIVYFPGCFANYYNPDIGKSLVEVMERNGVEVIVPNTRCCGMPQMANSNIKGARKNFDINVKMLAEAASPGYDILTTCPSCNMMLTSEGQEFFESDEARLVSSRVYDACHYLSHLAARRALNTNFGRINMRVFYHNPCHLRVQNIGDAVSLMKLIPGLHAAGISTSCCGMGGSYGMKATNYARSVEVAQKVWEEVRASEADIVATDCGGCGLQIQAGTGARIMHPVTVLSRAYAHFHR
jgi:Fe-S oxidoreductase